MEGGVIKLRARSQSSLREQSRKFTMTEMAISTPTYYTLKYLGGITHVPVLRCTNYIQVVYFFWWFRTILST